MLQEYFSLPIVYQILILIGGFMVGLYVAAKLVDLIEYIIRNSGMIAALTLTVLFILLGIRYFVG